MLQNGWSKQNKNSSITNEPMKRWWRKF